MQLTTNLKLKKPEIADAVNIDDLNSNADTLDTEVAKIASTSQAGRMSVTDKTKLDGIQAGAQVNAVTSVASRTGAVILSKTDVGLSSVDNAKQATKTEFDSHVADEVKHITAAERTSWNAKASTAAATSSAAGLMAAVDKTKLDGIAAGANNYVHPANHPPSIIAQDASNRFVTDAEKAAWNAKASTGVATTSAAGLMAAADKSKLDGIAAGANNYIHPATHSPSIISQDANNRFVTDAERIVWNNKASTDFVQSEIDNKSVKKEIVLPLNTDLDNVVSTGFYRLQSGNLNAPVGSDWSQMIVSHAGGDTVGQMILGHGTGDIYVRTGNPPAAGGTGVWTIWRRVEFKNDVFQAYPHIDQNTVWLNSPDFPISGLSGFTANFISSIDTVITHIAINNVKYQVSNEGEGTVSVVNNGTYAFVWSHGYFFLRSGGGGGRLSNVQFGTLANRPASAAEGTIYIVSSAQDYEITNIDNTLTSKTRILYDNETVVASLSQGKLVMNTGIYPSAINLVDGAVKLYGSPKIAKYQDGAVRRFREAYYRKNNVWVKFSESDYGYNLYLRTASVGFRRYNPYFGVDAQSPTQDANRITIHKDRMYFFSTATNPRTITVVDKRTAQTVGTIALPMTIVNASGTAEQPSVQNVMVSNSFIVVHFYLSSTTSGFLIYNRLTLALISTPVMAIPNHTFAGGVQYVITEREELIAFPNDTSIASTRDYKINANGSLSDIGKLFLTSPLTVSNTNQKMVYDGTTRCIFYCTYGSESGSMRKKSIDNRNGVNYDAIVSGTGYGGGLCAGKNHLRIKPTNNSNGFVGKIVKSTMVFTNDNFTAAQVNTNYTGDFSLNEYNELLYVGNDDFVVFNLNADGTYNSTKSHIKTVSASPRWISGDFLIDVSPEAF